MELKLTIKELMVIQSALNSRIALMVKLDETEKAEQAKKLLEKINGEV